MQPPSREEANIPLEPPIVKGASHALEVCGSLDAGSATRTTTSSRRRRGHGPPRAERA